MAKPKRRIQPKTHRSVVNFNEAVKSKTRDTQLIPKSLNQEKYILALLDETQDIVIAHGPAGTGKTYLAMQSAIKEFRQGNVERIILTRPAVSVEEEKHGFLPGTLEEKMTPWVRPLFDVMREYYSAPEISKMLENQDIEISPLAFMRGRTFHRSWIIGDEMQSATSNQMKMLLTRIGEGSKIIITGDQEQAEHRFREVNGLSDLINRLHKSSHKSMSAIQFTHSDIRRHPIISDILDMYED